MPRHPSSSSFLPVPNFQLSLPVLVLLSYYSPTNHRHFFSFSTFFIHPKQNNPIMEANGRRRSVRAGVNTRAGSVWESRIKVDEFKGGIKVYNGDQLPNDPQSPTSPAPAASRRQTPRNLATAGTVASSGKRKTWKSDSLDGTIQIAGVSSVDGLKKSPIQGRKVVRSDIGIGSDGIVRSPAQITKKGRSDSSSLIEVAKSRSGELSKEEADTGKELGASVLEIEKNNSSGSGDNTTCKEFGVCEEEKVVSATSDANHGDEEEEEEEEETGKTEEESEKKRIDNTETKTEKPAEEVIEPKISPRKLVHQFENRAPPPVASTTVRKQPPPVMRRASVYQNITKPSAPSPSQSRNYRGGKQSKLQNLVDLVMWRDVSRSAFVFGSGTFAIISSSYTQDLNISFISVMSYLGLVYLAAIFLYRTLVFRGLVEDEEDDEDKGRYVVGEGEAIGLVKLVLPYLNECLLKIKALFSGDPSTTMKLAVLLFVLARCGGYITIWKMAKLGFFGVFILPKVCSSYSTQLTSCGNTTV
ncbi:Reticulon-like protein B21 [Linum grandiflorum]